MAALPYIQLYVADYLADTAHLTTEEHGAYLLLIFSYWQTGKPLRADRLASVARMSNERWDSVEDTLSEFFHVGPTHWNHFRIDADLEAVNSKVGKASAAGKASARAKAIKKQLEDNERSTVVDDSLQRNGNHTDTDTDTEQEDQKPCDQQAESPDLLGDQKQEKAPQVNIPYAEILKAYAEELPGLPQPRSLDPDRRQAVKAIWTKNEEFGSVDFFRRYFAYIAKSDFLMGGTGWTSCNFDWIFKPKNFRKITESTYHKEAPNA